MTSRSLSTAQVARILGMPEARVRAMARSGLCRSRRRGRGHAFTFQDLVVLRTAQELVGQRVPAARVRRALAALVAQLPEGRSLSGLRIRAEGTRVVVHDGGAAWNPDTGQTVLDFGVDELARRVADVHDASAARAAGPETAAEAAQRELERALALEESDPPAACEAYGRALERDPDLVDAYVNLGRLAHEAGKVHEAGRLWHQALERAPDDPIVHFNLALALEETDRRTAALRHYARAVELDPAFADAHYNLAELCERLGRRAQALRHYAAYRRLTR